MTRYAWIALSVIGMAELVMGIFLVSKISSFHTSKEVNPSVMSATTSIPPMSSTTPTNPTTPSTRPTLVPAQALNLTNWKITLPIGPAEHPIEIKQPELATYKIDPWFIVAPDGNGVRFRAAVNGSTTSGSGYPRSELREMTNDGQDKASWSSNSGTHTMTIDEAVTAVPQYKKHVVAGQIHDADDDIVVIRLELPKLYVNVNGKNVYTLDSNYTLGKRFIVKFVVNGDQTKVYYNNSTDPVYTLSKNYTDSYFKAGAYTQSNCSKEKTADRCNDSNYGEVVIYQISVSHQ